LYVSANTGTNWSLLEDAIPLMYTPGYSRLNQGWYAHDVAVDPTNTNNIYWCEMEMWRSLNGGGTFTRQSVWSAWNINFTTVGTTTEGNSTSYAHADVHRIYISPWNSNTLFICTDGGIFRSTNQGTAWSGLNGGLQTAQIYPNMGQSMQDANFAIGGMQDNEGFVYEGNAGCRRIGNLGDGFHAAIHPTNDNTCFIASYYLNIKRSTNRAVSFSNNLTVNPSSPPAENACFNAPYVMAPGTPATMYAGTYRLRKSTNTGTNWSLIGPDPLVNTQALIMYIAVAPSDANTLYVSVGPSPTTNPRLLKSTNGGTSFTNITAGLPDRYISDIAIDQFNPSRVAVTLSGFGSSHVYLTRDGGTTWSDVGGGYSDQYTHVRSCQQAHLVCR
jgi:hypothetical protein